MLKPIHSNDSGPYLEAHSSSVHRRGMGLLWLTQLIAEKVLVFLLKIGGKLHGQKKSPRLPLANRE